jgi:predicted nucleic acid-binding protein
VAKSFVDTNVFVYAIDERDRRKQGLAGTLITEVALSGDGVISAQVVQEFASNSVRKLKLLATETADLCDMFNDFSLVRPDVEMVRAALSIQATTSISFWDACILAAARHAGCTTLYTEDLNHGQSFGALRVVNPFR